jgi:hypothetical protein
MTEDLYDINKYTDQQLYDILDMNNPTDRELEAKIIHLIKKYENMQNDSGDQLALFFHKIYNRFFNTDDNIEGFQNPTPDPSNTMDPNNFALSNDESASALKNTILTQSAPTISPNDLTTPQTKQIGYEAQQISSVQQFDYSADKLQLNPLLKQTIKRIISIDSQYRDIKTNPLTSSFSFDLSEPLRDVVSLKLYSVQIPYTWYTIPKSYGSNIFYLKGATSGINDGNHDYKIEIKPGNYTPSELESTINQRFYDISNNTPTQMLYYDLSGISSASDVNFNGTPKLISYAQNTSKMTMNIDLQKVYTEAYYQLYFPSWTSPLEDSSGSIPGYIGFNNQVYNPCSITSNQTKYKTIDISGEVYQDYNLNISNNYFTVNVYSNTSLMKQYKITLQNGGSDYSGLASRSQIYDSINTTLQNYKDEKTGENVFERASCIEYIDIPINSNNQNAGHRYYKLTIILNRYIVKYIQNAKVEVVFPVETPTADNTFTIWVINTSIYALYNAFFFDTYTNPLSEFVSESPAVFSSYVVDTSTNIVLTCKKEKYTGRINDISMNIPADSYTLNGLTDAITETFKTNSNKSPSNIIFYTTSTNTETKGAYIDPNTQKFTLTIDLEKKFTTQNYNISWDSTSLLADMDNFNVGSIWTDNRDLSSNLSNNILTHSIKNLAGTGYAVRKGNIFTITPNKNENITNPGNRNADPVYVNLTTITPTPTLAVPYSFSNAIDYINAINESINNVYVDGQRVLAGSSFTGTYIPSTKTYDLSLNISYNYSLTEKNYDISFVDYDYINTTSNFTWEKFGITSIYDLSLNNYYTTTEGRYAVITGNTQISGDQITVLDGSNTIILQTNGLSQYSIPNKTITLKISPAKYTINSLYTEINTQISKNPMLYGSQISKIEFNSKVYTKFILTINNIYTSKDYNIVFYDPFSFAKCYSGSRSVQNTTWDSTLGWILGYRDYTQYSLISSNQIFNGDGSYYLTSQNGSYTYSSVTDAASKLLTNIAITLEGDTTVSTNLYNYFLISLDDYIQNHLNDGLVTITRKETALSLPDYSYATTQICDPTTNTLTSISTVQSNSDNVTNKQLYSLNQSIYSQKNALKTYSSGPFIKDLFGFIPIKPPSKNGDYYIEFGGSLQNQERLYFGPVNIRKMSIQLLNDRGDVVDLNNSNWSFSFICEQLYRASSS